MTHIERFAQRDTIRITENAEACHVFGGGRTRRRPRRRHATRCTTWLALSLLLLGAAGCGDGSGSDGNSGPGTDLQGVMLPVWVLLDGDTPVAGARVRVYAGDGQAEEQHPAEGDPLTSDAGTALLAFDSLPQAFTVVVSDGRAEGRDLHGSLSARVRAYSNGRVVHVTPVTSLVEQWEGGERSMDRTAEVHAALGIPEWADEFDLYATDKWFDGDTFLDYADGKLDETLAQLLSDIERGESDHFTAQANPPQPPQEGEWWRVDVPGLIKGGFQDLGYSIFASGLEQGGRYLVGRLLDQWGLKSLSDFVNGPPDTQIIIEMLNALSVRLTTLQETVESTKQAVAESQYSNLVKDMTRDWTGPIDAITRELDFIARAAPTPPAMPAPTATPDLQKDKLRMTYSMMVQEHIRDTLAGAHFAGLKMHQLLDTPAPLANDILKAASQVYGTRRFFTAKSSASINAIYEYFALYQFRLAMLLTNYETSLPNAMDRKEIVKADIDAIEENINKQKTERLKPPVPDDKFVDTRHMKIWDRRPPWVSGAPYKPNETCRREYHNGPLNCVLNDPTWRERSSTLATEGEVRDLIEGYTGRNPLEWLRLTTGLVTSAPGNTPRDWVGHMWLGPEPVGRIRFGSVKYVQVITRINLIESDRPGPHVFTTWLSNWDPQYYFAHAMTVQSVEPGTYWWPFGGR